MAVGEKKPTLGLKVRDRVRVKRTEVGGLRSDRETYTGVIKEIDPYSCSTAQHSEMFTVTLDAGQGRAFLVATVYFENGRLMSNKNAFTVEKIRPARVAHAAQKKTTAPVQKVATHRQ